MRLFHPQQSDRGGCGCQSEAGCHHTRRTEPRDQPPGEKARRIHRDDVPLRPKLDESCDRPHKRERLARGKRVADDGTGCVHDGGIRPGKRLRNRKPQHIGTARTERGYETDRSRGFSV